MGLKILLLPCIYVYKFLSGIIKCIIRGFILTFKTIFKFLGYAFKGFKIFPIIILSVLSKPIEALQILSSSIKQKNKEKRELKIKKHKEDAKKIEVKEYK